MPTIDEYIEPFAEFFYRSEARDLGKDYIAGLMMEGNRKSIEPMSERINASERGMQRLLTNVKWDEEKVLPDIVD